MKPDPPAHNSILMHPGPVLFFFLTSAALFLPANDPPKVKILEPAHNSSFSWGSVIPYKIEVTDQEDGMSQYDEIDPNDVFMKITYIQDTSRLSSALALENTIPEPAGLKLAIVGKCFTCHAKKSRLIGPSWEAISEQYANNPDPGYRLASSVLQGSEGKWGTEIMPPTELVDSTEATQIIQWILQVGGDKMVNFLPGLSGAFETIRRPEDHTGTGGYILTALYTDHGGENPAELPLHVKASIVLQGGEYSGICKKGGCWGR